MRSEINMDFMDVVERGLVSKWNNELYSTKYSMDLSRVTRISTKKQNRIAKLSLPLAFFASDRVVGLLFFFY